MAYTGKKPVDHTDVTQSQSMTVTDDLTVDTNTLKVDSTNNRVGINLTSPDEALTVSGNIQIEDNDGYLQFKDSNGGTDNKIRRLYNSEQNLYISRRNDDNSLEANDVSILSDGKVGIGTSSPAQALQVSGAGARIYITAANEDIDMTGSCDGQISIDGNGYAGGIALNDQGMNIYTNTTTRRIIFGLNEAERFRINTTSIAPSTDNLSDLGTTSKRFDDVRATNGTIQTSDQNEKQQIASLTDAEITAAKAISKLFKTFKWNDKVEAKGDAARTHTGVIAQQVQQAMTDAGLDATKYAFWCSDTWLEFEGKAYEGGEGDEEAPEGATERTRLGIRYPELLAFIGAATEQRLTDIETRLTALET